MIVSSRLLQLSRFLKTAFSQNGEDRGAVRARSESRGRTNVATVGGKAEEEGSRERERSLFLLLPDRGVGLVPALLANLAPRHIQGVVPLAGLRRPALAARRPRIGQDFRSLRRTGNENGAR